MKRALITGITGQDGSYLAELLLEKGYEVHGVVRRSSAPNYWRIEHLLADISLVEADLTDSASLDRAVRLVRPEEVYNLAAQSFVGVSWAEPRHTLDVTGTGTLNLLEAVRQYAPQARFYQASTSELFGTECDADGMQDENTPFAPQSPYAIAKLYAYWMIRSYRQSYGMYCCNGILFNHESPRRGKEFVTRKITHAVARIARGVQESLLLGNLDAKRDWGFAGDYVRAMWMMLQQGAPEDLVVATGEAHSVRDFVQAAFAAAGVDDWPRYVKQDPRFMRPAEVPLLCGRAERAKKVLEWRPATSFHELVEMMVASDLEKVSETKTVRDELLVLRRRLDEVEARTQPSTRDK